MADRLGSEGSIPADEVAYLIIEPIQGEGGYRIPSDRFMGSIAEICSEHGIFLIADEIQCGLGRTGSMWAADSYPIEPDVIAAGKGLRVGATISRSDIFPVEEGRISSTWGAGDILAAMQGVLTIDTILSEGLMDNAVKRGNQIVEMISDSAPVEMTDVRGKGLMIGVDFRSKEIRDDVVESAFEHGLLTLGCGFRTLRLLPPLDLTAREAEMGVTLLLEAIDSVS